MHTTSSKISLQQYADEMILPEFRQKLKNVQELIEAHKWEDAAKPMCCGTDVKVDTCIGSPYAAECTVCGKWAYAADAPNFDKSSVQFLDCDKVDLDTEYRWVIGTKPSIDEEES